ncbi:MAG: translation elongation factor-like protein [Candidatus Micrarchaeia archaeon]
MAKIRIGVVDHYYDKSGAVVVTLEGEVGIGDRIYFRKGEKEVEQKVSSIQVNHINVERGFKGDSVGIKVDQPVEDGSEVYKEV